MAVKVAINGFGRIGRLVLRAIVESGRDRCRAGRHQRSRLAWRRTPICSASTAFMAAFPARSSVAGDTITIKTEWPHLSGRSSVSAERDPTSGAADQGVDVALECTGHLHLQGLERVEADHRGGPQGAGLRTRPTAWMPPSSIGVNQQVILTSAMTVVSNASCTTNCLAPMAKVLHETFSAFERGYMVTIHSLYRRPEDRRHVAQGSASRPRGGGVDHSRRQHRGGASAVGLVLPELKGKLDGTAIRVPTPNVSLVSLDVNLAQTCQRSSRSTRR